MMDQRSWKQAARSWQAPQARSRQRNIALITCAFVALQLSSSSCAQKGQASPQAAQQAPKPTISPAENVQTNPAAPPAGAAQTTPAAPPAAAAPTTQTPPPAGTVKTPAIAPAGAAQSDTEATQTAGFTLTPDQLDSLVAPVALYPDPLLAQVLVASTYPLEIVQLQQWLLRNSTLKDKALADTVKKQDWDPSIQALAPMKEVVDRLANDIKWTTDLGNAFLAQQSDVMDSVQRMRKKAQDAGTLKSTEQQKVETKVVEEKTVVVIEQANPQVVYVPSYNPVVVWGAPVYPYPPIYYPPPGYYAAGVAISFGVGMAMGAAWGGAWGWGCGWGGNDIDIDIDNDFNRNVNRDRDRNVNRSGDRAAGNKWQHNPQHRGGAPYSDRATADRFGGGARGDSLSSRQTAARQNAGTRQTGNLSGARAQTGTANRTAPSARSAGGDRVGNRSVPSYSGGSNRGAFGGASSGGATARAASSRGSRSMGGGGFRGGGRRR